ncbi:MAG: glycosyltransferase family 4 protein [Steroidobacteraceae bacterium]|nr:glycosyltransferase family 4 protein [Nevskiaceae bacterium]
MKTVLSVNNYYYFRGGAETVFLEQNRLLEEAGWRVVPFAMRHPKNLPTPWSDNFVDEIEFGGSYSLGQKLVRVPKVIYSFEARRRIGRLLDAHRPALCHAHNIYHHISPSILGLLRRRGVPTVMTLHDLKIACPAYNMLSGDGICERCRGGRIHNVVRQRCIKGSVALSGIAYAEAMLHRWLGSYTRDVDRFIVPSRFYIDKFVEWGYSPERFRHVPNFVDADQFTPNYEPGGGFVYFGRLSREKGVPTLVRAAARAGVSLRLVGTGPQEAELKELARELGASVEFMGYQTGQALHRIVGEARAVVLPSEWYENAPMSILEAYALGTPVIGAAIGGIPELVRPGVTGDLFPSGDVDQLAGVLARYEAMAAEDIVAMGREACSWARESFSSRAYVERITDVYRELGVALEGIEARIQ